MFSDPEDLRVVVEQGDQRAAQQHGCGAEQHGDADVQHQAGPDGLPQTVVAARAEILTDKGHHGDAEGVGDRPVDAVDFPEGGPCRYGIGSEPVDGGLNEYIGNAVHGGLQAGGETDAEHMLQLRAAEIPPAELQLIDIPGLQKRAQYQGGAHKLRDAGGDGCAGGGKGDHQNQKQIQDNIDKAADNQIIQRPAGDPPRPAECRIPCCISWRGSYRENSTAYNPRRTGKYPPAYGWPEGSRRSKIRPAASAARRS